jgi:PIN domain nuclease of toxin-antitoxin system
MNILLDTCVFLWIVQEPEKISAAGKTSFADPANAVFLSSITPWEISLKYSLGKLPLPVPPRIFIPEALAGLAVTPLPLTNEDTFHLTGLPDLHKDPFDRMLICQAIEHGLTILTPDEAIQSYPVKTLW